MVRRLLFLIALLVLVPPGIAGAAQVEPRIVGGTQVQEGDYPWQVALLSAGGSQYCGGTLIAREWVLTADHCWPALTERARVKSVYRHSGGEVYDIAEVVRHPQADGREDPVGHVPSLRYDVNLVRLSAPVADARPLVVADSSHAALWDVGDLLTVTGWGTTSSGSASSTMQEAQVPRVSDPACSTAYGGDFDAGSMFCAAYAAGGVDTCQGDSGGPITAPTVASPSKRNPAHWRLVGVTSWGTGCALADYPGVYARITEPVIRDWITATIPAEEPVDTTLIDAPPAQEEPQQEVPAELPTRTLLPIEDPAPETTQAPAAQTAPTPTVTTPSPSPLALAVRRRCTRLRRCTFALTPGGPVAKVRVTVSTTIRRTCRKGGRRTTCRKVTTRTLRVRRSGAGFTTVGARLRKGQHTLVATPYGADGRRAGAAKRYRFSVR